MVVRSVIDTVQTQATTSGRYQTIRFCLYVGIYFVSQLLVVSHNLHNFALFILDGQAAVDELF